MNSRRYVAAYAGYGLTLAAIAQVINRELTEPYMVSTTAQTDQKLSCKLTR